MGAGRRPPSRSHSSSADGLQQEPHEPLPLVLRRTRRHIHDCADVCPSPDHRDPPRHRNRMASSGADRGQPGVFTPIWMIIVFGGVGIFGPGGGASDTTMLRVLDELAGRLRPDGLPGRRLARAAAAARAKAWAGVAARHGGLPAVKVAGKDLTRAGAGPAASPVEAACREVDQRPRPVLVVRLDATLIDAASDKAQAAGTYKQGYGFHPLTAWCTNVGDSLAVMLRPGNAGSFTASDHIAVIDAAFGQISASWRADVLVTIDGAGASHGVSRSASTSGDQPWSSRAWMPATARARGIVSPVLWKRRCLAASRSVAHAVASSSAWTRVSCHGRAGSSRLAAGSGPSRAGGA